MHSSEIWAGEERHIGYQDFKNCHMWLLTSSGRYCNEMDLSFKEKGTHQLVLYVLSTDVPQRCIQKYQLRNTLLGIMQSPKLWWWCHRSKSKTWNLYLKSCHAIAGLDYFQFPRVKFIQACRQIYLKQQPQQCVSHAWGWSHKLNAATIITSHHPILVVAPYQSPDSLIMCLPQQSAVMNNPLSKLFTGSVTAHKNTPVVPQLVMC